MTTTWICPYCGIRVPMEPEEFPITCVCGFKDYGTGGLGDRLARFLAKIRIKKWKNCGCDKRQRWLNEKFPGKD